ncbi:unnamed protein product, partial [Effrenium voratum]
VVVDCCGLSYQTATLENRSSLAPWNEYCTWPNVSLHPQEFESSFVEFKVYARHWFTRNYLIGKASLQLSFVNKRQNHLHLVLGAVSPLGPLFFNHQFAMWTILSGNSAFQPPTWTPLGRHISAQAGF